MLLSRADIPQIVQAMKQLIYFTTAAAQMNTRKRDAKDWSDNLAPAKAHKCRSLTRHPAGAALPDYEPKLEQAMVSAGQTKRER